MVQIIESDSSRLTQLYISSGPFPSYFSFLFIACAPTFPTKVLHSTIHYPRSHHGIHHHNLHRNSSLFSQLLHTMDPPTTPRPNRRPKKPKGKAKDPPTSALSEQLNGLHLNGRGDFDVNGNFILPADANTTTQSSKKIPHMSSKKHRSSPYQSDTPQHDSSHSITIAVDHSPTPPWLGKTPKQLYAAPNFSNSPDASALPIPKFALKKLSKSLPNATSQPSLQSRLDQEAQSQESSESSSSCSSATPSPTPQAARLAQDPSTTRDSPLDFLFQAARTEKTSASPSNSAQKRPVQQLSTPRDSALDFLFEADRAEKSQQTKRSPSPPILPPANPNHWASIYGNAYSHTRSKSQGAPTSNRSLGSRSVTEPLNVPVAPENQPHPFVSQPPSSVYSAPGYGQSTPFLPSEMDGTPPHRTPNSISSHDSPFPPRSAGSSPLPHGPQVPHNKSPHYGNRNLSPLFKASRAEPTRRPSNLRREIELRSPTTERS